MTLPASGQIHMSQVNTELSRASTAQTSLGETAVRNLANVASGQIGFSNLHGKSAGSIVNPTGGTSSYSWGDNDYDFGDARAYIYVDSDGTVTLDSRNSGWMALGTGKWWSAAPATGIGSSKYFRRTLQSTSGSSSGTSWSGNLGWTAISSRITTTVTAITVTGSKSRTATYLLEFSNDGVNVAGSCTVTLDASCTYIG